MLKGFDRDDVWPAKPVRRDDELDPPISADARIEIRDQIINVRALWYIAKDRLPSRHFFSTAVLRL
jgi:hypothetical protein